MNKNEEEEEAEEVIRVMQTLLNEIKQRHSLVTIFFVISFHESIIIAKKSVSIKKRPSARVAEAAELGIFK